MHNGDYSRETTPFSSDESRCRLMVGFGAGAVAVEKPWWGVVLGCDGVGGGLWVWLGFGGGLARSVLRWCV